MVKSNNTIAEHQPTLLDTITDNTVKRIEKSTATVLELRSGIFAPIGKISERSIIQKEFLEPDKATGKPANVRRFDFYSGPYRGTIEIKNVILTQVHRALLEAILSGKDSISKADGEIEIKCTLKGVQEYYDGTVKLQWFKDKLEEMRTSAINIVANDMDTIIESSNLNFSVISTYSYRADTKVFTINLNNKYSKIFDDQITINYSKFVKEINSIKSPLVQAVVRFFITQEKCTYGLDKIIAITGYGTTERARRKAIQDINKEKDKLLSFNIVWDNKRKVFEYERTKNIYIYHPEKKEIDEKIQRINNESSSNDPKEIEETYQSIAKKYFITNFDDEMEAFKLYNNNDEGKINLFNWKKWCEQQQKYSLKTQTINENNVVIFAPKIERFKELKDISEKIVKSIEKSDFTKEDYISLKINDENSKYGVCYMKNPETESVEVVFLPKEHDVSKLYNLTQKHYDKGLSLEEAFLKAEQELKG